uniref:Uncharacterized protein n=1 Tax=Romanomermis culicivorax TaxID=13658 RepID=A0A915IJE5_ROMCU
MSSEITIKILVVNLTPPSLCQPIFKPTLTISMASATGDHPAEHHPKEVPPIPMAHAIIFTKNTYAIYPNPNFMPPWEQHIHYNVVPAPDSSGASLQSLELRLALPALP